MGTHNQPPHEVPHDARESSAEVTFPSIMRSVFASFFGVQSNENRIRDFQSGKFWHFFFAGLLFVALLLGGVALAVKVIIATA